jgi:two-component system chemotaxis response regulator CheB
MQAHLQASEAIEGELIEPGRIYVVPPDRHLLIGDNHLHLTRGPKEGLHRPSINITFRSAAAAYGDRVIGILLSGMLDDGASGLWEIARRGGVTIVQDPDEALFPSMPLNALQDAPVHYKLKASDIGVIVSGLVNGGEMFNSSPGEEPDNPEIQFSGFTCPECRGPLYQKAPAVGKRPGPIEFRCRVGHVLSLKTLFDEHTSTQERKLYEAIVALQEGAELAEYTAAHVAGVLQEELKREAQQLRRHADVVRKLVEERMTPVMD